jgi:hypothetical protein
MSSEYGSAGSGDDGREWRQVREEVLQRDDRECRFCGKTDTEHKEETGLSLDVHHLIPKADGGKDSMSNLAALCRSCHKTMENLHARAMTNLEPETNLGERVGGAADDIASRVHEDWFQLLGGPLVPRFEREAQGEGWSMANTDDLSPRERAAFYAGRVEASLRVQGRLRGALKQEGYGNYLNDSNEERPFWSDYIQRCGCGENFDTVIHTQCPRCGGTPNDDE